MTNIKDAAQMIDSFHGTQLWEVASFTCRWGEISNKEQRTGNPPFLFRRDQQICDWMKINRDHDRDLCRLDISTGL